MGHLLWLLAAVQAVQPVAPGWTAEPAPGFRAFVDTRTRHGGHPTLAIEAVNDAPGRLAVTQRIKADAYRGKRIRLSAFVKADETRDRGSVWLRIDFPNGDYVLDGSLGYSANERSTRDAAGWSPAVFVAAVPADALGISFGLWMQGAGSIRASALRLEVVPESTRTNTIERRGYKGKPGQKEAVEQLRRQFSGVPQQPVNLSFEQR